MPPLKSALYTMNKHNNNKNQVHFEINIWIWTLLGYCSSNLVEKYIDIKY